MSLKDLAQRARRPRPSQLEYVFVVTYGRSGSTLVQGLLNTLPRTLVRGENDFYVHDLYRAWAAVKGFQEKYAQTGAKKGARSAFYGIDEVDADSFVASAHDVAERALLGHSDRGEVDRVGFKEVLWHRIAADETEQFFDWFERVFPGARYILNRREHEQVATSGFWQTQEPEEVMRAIERVEDILGYLRETRPDRTLEVQYERLTSDDRAVSDKELRSIADFVLGSCDDDLLGRMRQTLGEGHGPRPFGRSRTGGASS